MITKVGKGTGSKKFNSKLELGESNLLLLRNVIVRNLKKREVKILELEL